MLSNIDVVIHLAALDAPTCSKNPLECNRCEYKRHGKMVRGI